MMSIIKKSESGFTLIEMMMVIAIGAILMTIAVPNFLTWRSNYRFRKATRDMYSNFQRARLAAIREHTQGTIVFNQTIGGNAYDYVVFVENLTDANDKPLNKNLKYDAGEKILAKVKMSDYENVTIDSITFSNNADDPAKPAVTFRPSGIPMSPSGAMEGGSVLLKNTKDGKVKAVRLAHGGRVRVTDTTTIDTTSEK